MKLLTYILFCCLSFECTHAFGFGLWGGVKLHSFANNDANLCDTAVNGNLPSCERVNTMAGFDFWIFETNSIHLGPSMAYIPLVEGTQSISGVTTSLNQTYLPLMLQARTNLRRWLLEVGIGFAPEITSPTSLTGSTGSTQTSEAVSQHAFALQAMVGYSIIFEEEIYIDLALRSYFLFSGAKSASTFERRAATIIVLNPSIGLTFFFDSP